MLGEVWDKIWRDDDGNVVIWQMPNVWLIGWAVLTFASLLFSKGHIANILTWAGEASLIIWCLLEIFKGVNYFRRALGIAVLVYAVITLLRTF
jgi:hypothetical protein